MDVYVIKSRSFTHVCMVIETCMWTLEKFHLCKHEYGVPLSLLRHFETEFRPAFRDIVLTLVENKEMVRLSIRRTPSTSPLAGEYWELHWRPGKTCTLSCKRDTCILITLHVKNILSQNSPFCNVKSSKLLVVLILCPCFHFRPRVGGTQMCGCTIEFWRRGCFLLRIIILIL